MAERIVLPVTEDGNDFADYDQATMDRVNRQIDAVQEKSGKLTPRALKKRQDFLALCREFQARTGHPLCRIDTAVVKQYTADLKNAGML